MLKAFAPKSGMLSVPPAILNACCCANGRPSSFIHPSARLSRKKIKKVVFLFRDPVIRAHYIISGLRQKKEVYADPQANLCRKEFLQLLFSSRLYLCANYQEFVFWRVEVAPSKPADIGISREKSSLPMQGAEPALEQWTLDPSLVPRKQKEKWGFLVMLCTKHPQINLKFPRKQTKASGKKPRDLIHSSDYNPG